MLILKIYPGCLNITRQLPVINSVQPSIMKTALALFSAAILLTLTLSRANADILAGPITNPNNGHDYYLLTPDSWSACEVEAENLGGTLAIIKNAAEENWIYTNFAEWQGSDHVLWFGLHRQYPAGPFIWVTGQPINYWNWCDGQPDNGGGIQDCACIWSPRNGWDDEANAWQNYGVVEIPGKSGEKSLSDKEKSLVGTWYESGHGDSPTYVTATKDRLFCITTDGRAGRLIYDPAGFIFVAVWNTRGEVIQDHILWSNGTWWSRKPSNDATNSLFRGFRDYPEIQRTLPGTAIP
jgi:hypothetical protein